MDRRWLPLNALRAFEAVGRHLSFTAAANSLLVSQSAVSRHVIALEGLLGVQLIERRPQQIALTDAGRLLLPVVTKSFDRLAATLDAVVADDTSPKRVLTVQMPPSFAHHLAVPILRDFRKDCPDVVIEVTGPGRRDADLTVAYARQQVGELVSDLLWDARLTPLCHPDLLYGDGLQAFVARGELLHVKLDGLPRCHLWERFVRQQGLRGIDVDRGLVFDTAILAAQYALSGEGVALLDPLLFEHEISAGRLVAPFDAWLEDGWGYRLITHPDDLGDSAIALFRSWLIARFAARARYGTDAVTSSTPVGAEIVPIRSSSSGGNQR